MRKTLILFLFFTAGINASAQHYILDSILLVHVQIIHKEHNTFAYADSSDSFRTFFGKLDSLYEGHRKNIQIFHIGGSHIQADFYSNKVREYLRNITLYTHSSRGLIFPYRLAGTNNPLNYNITGNSALWKGYRSSLSRDTAYHTHQSQPECAGKIALYLQQNPAFCGFRFPGIQHYSRRYVYGVCRNFV